MTLLPDLLEFVQNLATKFLNLVTLTEGLNRPGPLSSKKNNNSGPLSKKAKLSESTNTGGGTARFSDFVTRSGGICIESGGKIV